MSAQKQFLAKNSLTSVKLTIEAFLIFTPTLVL